MFLLCSILAGVAVACVHDVPRASSAAAADVSRPRVTTVALRVFHAEAMERFHAEAFGFQFRDVRTGPVVSRFADFDGMTFKFVPIRASDEWEDFPTHQLGFEVDDIARIVAIAQAHGGRLEGELAVVDGRLSGAIRDPDGNTIELYERP